MHAARFDSTIKKLVSEWDFEVALEFFKDNAIANSKHLEFCVYLADLGLLQELHNFVCKLGLYNLKALAGDPSNNYEKRDNVKALLSIYETEMLPIFERQAAAPHDIDSHLLAISQYSDRTVIANYLLNNKNEIFQAEQSPKTLMYLTYAINQALEGRTDDKLLRLLLDQVDNFKKLSAVRKAYITKLIAQKLLLNNQVITFPKVGYNLLHKLLGIIVGQKGKDTGASRLYALVSDVIRPELNKIFSTKSLGHTNKPRVAVCLSGMYRCGNLALDSVYRNVIEPLEADVFFHTWEEMQEWPGLGGAGDDWILRIFSKEIFDVCPSALRSKKFFRDNFPRTFKIIDTASTSTLTPSKLSKNIEFKEILFDNAEEVFQRPEISQADMVSLGSLNQAKMLYGIYTSHELAVKYEKAQGFRYDYIIRCRPDIGLHNKLDFPALENLAPNEVAMDFTKEYGPQDQFWYARRDAALTMASLWAASMENKSLSPFPEFPQMRAHGLIFGWMTANNLQPLHTAIKRDMKVATAQATPPDFSVELAEDLKNEAVKFSDNQDFLGFFAKLQEFNKQ